MEWKSETKKENEGERKRKQKRERLRQGVLGRGEAQENECKAGRG